MVSSVKIMKKTFLNIHFQKHFLPLNKFISEHKFFPHWSSYARSRKTEFCVLLFFFLVRASLGKGRKNDPLVHLIKHQQIAAHQKDE